MPPPPAIPPVPGEEGEERPAAARPAAPGPAAGSAAAAGRAGGPATDLASEPAPEPVPGATDYDFERPEAEAAWRERFQRYARHLDLDWEEQLWRQREEEARAARDDPADPEP